MEDSLSIGFLVARIEVPQLLPITVEIKTLVEKDISWEDVTTRVIEESKSLQVHNINHHLPHAASTVFQICSTFNHCTEIYFSTS